MGFVILILYKCPSKGEGHLHLHLVVFYFNWYVVKLSFIVHICVCLYFRLKMALAGSLNAADITAALQACSGNISP